MRGSLGDKVRLQHILDAVIEIESYTKQTTYELFLSNTMMQYACIKQLEIIGEAANHLSAHIKNLHSEIAWREITDLRNLLIHEYFGIDTRIVWEIINTDISILKPQIKEIVEQL